MLNNSYDILKSYYNSPEKLNDLYTPAVMECPKLGNYKKSGYFLSGSGSSFLFYFNINFKKEFNYPISYQFDEANIRLA